MVALIVVGYVGVGWALWKAHPRVVKLSGKDHFHRWSMAYARSLGALFPKDTDGDGFADSLEMFLHSNPHDGNAYPECQVHDLAWENAGFVLFAFDGFRVWPAIVLHPGERRRVCARAYMDEKVGAFSPGMKLILTPEAPGVIGLPGGTLSPSPLEVPVAADGLLVFDLSVPLVAVASRASMELAVAIQHPVSGYDVGSIGFGIASEESPRACAVDKVGNHVSDSWHGMVRVVAGEHIVLLRWPAGSDPALQMIEASRDESGVEWFPLGCCDPSNTSVMVSYDLEESDHRHHWGPMRFRVVSTGAPPPPPRQSKEW